MTASFDTTNVLDLPEQADDPPAPPANTARLYTKDVGGATGLFVLLPTGNPVRLA